MPWHILASRLQLFIWTIKNTASAEPQNQTEAFISGGTLSVSSRALAELESGAVLGRVGLGEGHSGSGLHSVLGDQSGV